jgi:hypothetical protein
MKLNSVEHRTKDHKRIKDITDIFALLWYSEPDLREMRARVSKFKESKEIARIISKFKENEIKQASNSMDYDSENMRNIP